MQENAHLEGAELLFSSGCTGKVAHFVGMLGLLTSTSVGINQKSKFSFSCNFSTTLDYRCFELLLREENL